jgi:sarcosine oxidase delta subunit
MIRAVEEHHRYRGEKRSALSEKNQYKSNGHHHSDRGANQADAKQHQTSDHDLMATSNGNGGEKGGFEHFEWPRIYISLSRKEKEDDFLVMKGTKLPQRPKKRAKNVDKTLQVYIS